jgi:hypothetical protein
VEFRAAFPGYQHAGIRPHNIRGVWNIARSLGPALISALFDDQAQLVPTSCNLSSSHVAGHDGIDRVSRRGNKK